jgi:hypothetical protein
MYEQSSESVSIVCFSDWWSLMLQQKDIDESWRGFREEIVRS